MSNSFYHKELTDAQWNRIKFVFEEKSKVGRPPLNPRIVFNAIMWILKSGARWRDLPARYGNWNSIYHKFRRWCSLGLFDRLMKIINANVLEATLLEIDSTFCKVHQSACSALKDQAIGSSRGGKNTKNATFESDVDRRANSRQRTGYPLHSRVKQCLRIKHTVASIFVVTFSNMEPLRVSPTKPISGLSMTLVLNCTNNAIFVEREFFLSISGKQSKKRLSILVQATTATAKCNLLIELPINMK